MADMLELTKGANAALPSTTVRATISWAATPSTPAVDLTALALTVGGKVSTDDDMTFYNAPAHPSGRIFHRGNAAGPGTDTVEADLAGLPPTIDRVVLAASADGAPFGSVGGLRLGITDSNGVHLAAMTLNAGVETALVVAELYRRAGSWKVRCVNAGYADGLAGLARDYGITVDSPTAAPTPAPARQSAPAAAPTTPAAAPPPPAPAPARPAGIDWMNPPVPAGYEI